MYWQAIGYIGLWCSLVVIGFPYHWDMAFDEDEFDFNFSMSIGSSTGVHYNRWSPEHHSWGDVSQPQFIDPTPVPIPELQMDATALTSTMTSQWPHSADATVFTPLQQGEGFLQSTMQGGTTSVVKSRGMQPRMDHGPRQRSTAKRSYKRAQRRLCRLGHVTYRGQTWYTGYRDLPDPVPVIRPTTPSLTSRPNRRRLTVLNWNIGGMSTERFDLFHVWLKTNPYDVILLQESHWSFSSEWDAEGYWRLHSGAGTRFHSGLLVLISKKVIAQHHISWNECIPGRLMHIRLHFSHRHHDFIHCYQHPARHNSQADRDHFWTQLQDVLDHIPNRHLITLAGDLNTSSRRSSSSIGLSTFCKGHVRASGPSHVDEDTWHGILQKYDLVALNTWTHSHQATFQNEEAHSRIDYICTRRRHADRLARSTKQLHAHPMLPLRGPHHVPLVATVCQDWHFAPANQPPAHKRRELVQLWRQDPTEPRPHC